MVIIGVQTEAVLAAKRSLITVEEIVDSLDPKPQEVILPAFATTYIAVAPGGAHPSYAQGYSFRDNAFYTAWDAVSRDRDTFLRWMDENVLHRATVARPNPTRRTS